MNRLMELEAIWKKAKFDSKAIYEIFRDAVLPETRPGEVFLYLRPSNYGGTMQQPQSGRGYSGEIRGDLRLRPTISSPPP